MSTFKINEKSANIGENTKTKSKNLANLLNLRNKGRGVILTKPILPVYAKVLELLHPTYIIYYHRYSVWKIFTIQDTYIDYVLILVSVSYKHGMFNFAGCPK